MQEIKTYYKRHLPHYQPEGYTFFVTFRLTGSLPVEVIRKLKEEREKELKLISGYVDKKVRYEKYKTSQSLYFGKFYKLLDGSAFGPKWLKEEKAAQVVKEAIHIRDNKEYELIAYTIMPNHVHIIFTPISSSIVGRSEASTSAAKLPKNISEAKVKNEANASFYIVTKILQDLKSKTALKCNKLLNRSGAFWQHESYDHVVRDENELGRIVEYVRNNPVKVGFCENWEDWKYSYCNFKRFDP
ncbi:MAG: transposase [Bacteroidota bacterium]